TDGERVYTLFGSGVLAALDFEGKILWREELPHLRDIDSGLCSSPVLYEDTVIVPSIADAGLRAHDRRTGNLKWEQKTRDRNKMPTPAIFTTGGKPQLIHFAGGIQGLDPATGELIWSCRTAVSYSSPVFANGLIYADSGRGGKTAALIDPTGKG